MNSQIAIYFLLCVLTLPIIATWLGYILRHMINPQFPYRFIGLLAVIIVLIELAAALIIF